MPNIHWSEDILSKLNIRDEFEKKDSVYFNAFVQLSQLSKLSGSSGNEDYAKLVNENYQLKTRNESLIENLNQSTINLEKVEAKLNQYSKTIQNLEKTNKYLNQKINHLNLEINEKNKSIEIINDEFLLNQIQINVLNDKIKDLTNENESLIKRWMEKVKNDAEQLNDANEFLESINKRQR